MHDMMLELLDHAKAVNGVPNASYQLPVRFRLRLAEPLQRLSVANRSWRECAVQVD